MLVGRDAELARLTSALSGAAPVFVLAGEAGVGKTRCLAAFLDGAERAGATVVLGHCPPLVGAELPFAAVADALRRLGTWIGAEDSALVRLVPDMFPDAAPRPDGGGSVSRIFAETLGMLRRMAGQAPVVLAVEDVHWADRSTRDLLGLLVRAAAVLASSGTEVPHALLATVLGTPDGDDLVAAARAAVAAHLLRATATGYAFRHALTREAVESDLLPVERERLNAAAAGALGAGSDPVTAARVAYHWHAAGDADRALAAAVTAGLAARASYAFAAAQELFERAISLWPRVDDPPGVAGVDEAGLYELTAEAIYLNRHERGAVELAGRALALLDPAAEPERAARLHLLAGAAHWSYTGDARTALDRADTALALLPDAPPTGAHAQAARPVPAAARPAHRMRGRGRRSGPAGAGHRHPGRPGQRPRQPRRRARPAGPGAGGHRVPLRGTADRRGGR